MIHKIKEPGFNPGSFILLIHFDLNQAKYAGLIISANKNVLSKIPESSMKYTASIIGDMCGKVKKVFKKINIKNYKEDKVNVCFMFSGFDMII